MAENENKEIKEISEVKEWPRGVSPIKREFVLKIFDNEDDSRDIQEVEDNDDKKRKFRGKNFERNKKIRGMNKGRHLEHVKDNFDICNHFIHGTCKNGDNCRFGHNLKEYLKHKPADLEGECINISLYGSCPYGIKCRFYYTHKDCITLEELENGEVSSTTLAPRLNSDTTTVAPETTETDKSTNDEQKNSNTLNIIRGNIQKLLRKKVYKFSKYEEFKPKYIEYKKERDVLFEVVDRENKKKHSSNINSGTSEEIKEEEIKHAEHEAKLEKFDKDTIAARFRPQEKKRIDFRDKLYCAPLTTVGNLPFRRIIKSYGCDITCGEMAVAKNILDGNKNEWALVRRHRSEDIFGVQLTGGHPDEVIRAAEVINNEAEVDFIDVNMGCPIDNIFQMGAGSALMGKTNKMREMFLGMNYSTTCPITVKMRTGIFKNKNTAHNLLPRLSEWGIQLATLHGRTREQRYTKLADYDYIKKCSDALEGKQMALYGNGDIFSWEEYYSKKEASGVSGIMIGRGALIKPWIFKEIKDRSNYDISATERLEIMNTFAKYGLEHWGTDTLGVNNTRRYLCEWQSFLHRYIPLGLMEVLPQHINDRPPVYFGRNELETLMASPKCSDWIKLTERTILGPTPENFTFIPKHKANAYQG